MFVAVELADGAELLVKVFPGELSLALDLGTFQREVGLLTGRLGHPRLVAPREAGRAGTLVYHTRRFIDGTTLRAWLARDGELPLRQSVALLRDVLEALAHAHAAGIVHGDLKPENVLVVENGRALAAGRRRDRGGADAVRGGLRPARADGRRRPRGAARRCVRGGGVGARDAHGTSAGARSGAARGGAVGAAVAGRAGAALSCRGAGGAVVRRGRGAEPRRAAERGSVIPLSP